MKNRNGKVLSFMVGFLTVICIGLFVFIIINREKLFGNDESINNNHESNEKNNVNDFPIVKVNNLNSKLSKLDFSDKSIVSVMEADEEYGNIEIFNGGKVKIKLMYDNKSVEYVVDNISNAKSVKGGYSVQGGCIFYILTKDGKVYESKNWWSEDLDKAFEYKTTAEDLLINDAISIAVPRFDIEFHLKEDEDTYSIEPAVYIKTSNNRIFTNEVFLNNYFVDQSIAEDYSGLVEVNEK